MLAKTKLLLIFVSVLLCLPAVAEEKTLLLDDFDDGVKLSRRWTAIGKIGVARTEVTADVVDGKHGVDGVQGMLAECDAQPQSKFLVNQAFRRPAYENYDTIRFRLRAKNATKENPLAFEFQFFSQERRAALWRKFSVDTDRWQTIDLPLQHFRYSTGAVVDWAEVSRFGIHFRDAANVSLDGFELVAKEEVANPFFTPNEVGRFAFRDNLLTSGNEHFVLLTDDERVDQKATLAELDKLYEMLYADFPDLAKPARKVPILIFAKKDEYQRFWIELGALYASEVPLVRSNGYSLLGVAGTFYSDEYGSVRPVLIHEACHALLAAPLGLSNSSEWLHEGLANYYQLNWTKQDIHKLNRKRIEAGRHLPLRELLNGQSVAIRDYGQITLFTKFLVEDDERKAQLFAAMKEMRQKSSTKFEPISKKFFGKPIDDLELDYLRWARDK